MESQVHHLGHNVFETPVHHGIERFKGSSQVASDYAELSLSKGDDKTCSLGENVGLDQSTIDSEGFKGGTRGSPIMPFAVRETASLGIMGAPRVPPLNPSESIVL